MYEAKHFTEERLSVQHDLIESHPLGLLVCNDSADRLSANPIPFMLHRELGEFGTLRAHIARPNPQWRDLQRVEECLIVFQGEQHYVSPNWYPSKQEHGKVVPTWNYVTVHVWGAPIVIDDSEWIRSQVDQLTSKQEASQANPWAVSDAPPDFTSSMIRGVVGIEIPISEIRGKWKVSQNRSQQDASGVSANLRKMGMGAMAEQVERYSGRD